MIKFKYENKNWEGKDKHKTIQFFYFFFSNYTYTSNFIGGLKKKIQTEICNAQLSIFLVFNLNDIPPLCPLSKLKFSKSKILAEK